MLNLGTQSSINTPHHHKMGGNINLKLKSGERANPIAMVLTAVIQEPIDPIVGP